MISFNFENLGVLLNSQEPPTTGLRVSTNSRQSYVFGLLLVRSVSGIMALKWQGIVRAFRT